MIPEQQAIATLRRGFELGVNWVHVSHEYGDAERLVARAIEESGKEIIVLAQASGDVDHFEACFENTCRTLGRRRLDMFGINCLNDCEYLNHNVWGTGGMTDFLARRKREGRLGAAFCTTHGPPQDIERAIRSGCFDAVMLADNPVGFHLFTYYPESLGRTFEDISQHRRRLFPVALEHGVSILVMKALGGGLLCRSRALPPHEWLASNQVELSARDLLQAALDHPAVCGVVVGTASVQEAEENARAGYEPIRLSDTRRHAIDQAVERVRTTVCSRCGQCESTCSRSLPISTMFRDAYVWNHRSEPSMPLDRENYFLLHPKDVLTCESCTDQTCLCPQGMSIPRSLASAHHLMLRLRENGLRPGTPEGFPERIVGGAYPLLVVSREIPERAAAGGSATCRLILHNAGDSPWLASASPRRGQSLSLAVYLNRRLAQRVAVRHDVPAGSRVAFAFDLNCPRKGGVYDLELTLLPQARTKRKAGTTVLTTTLVVDGFAGAPRPAGIGTRLRRYARDFRSRVRALKSARAGGEATPTYGVVYAEHDVPARVAPRKTVAVRLTLKNTSSFSWRAQEPNGHNVDLVARVNDEITATHKLSVAEVKTGEHVTVNLPWQAPAEPGRHTACFELVQQNVAWFRDRGVPPLTVDVMVDEGRLSMASQLQDLAARVSPWYYQPSHGLEAGRDGRALPQFVARAKGCRLWDVNGHEFIDYIMGWGTTLLGYADDRISAAIQAQLETAPLAPFPYPLEIEVAQMLTEDFPCAEMVIFGKNGSDVCTVAARVARALTGRRVILFSGYHGWQDFWVESVGFGRSGVPDRPEPLIHRFRFNDYDDFARLYQQHRHDLAAVMIEPSGPWGGDEVGPEPDADRAFLQAVAEATRRAGALLIFDEIVTCYRYPSGSVQEATGVTPDLACLGKGLASGMPLSALVGRRELMRDGLPRTHYGPTFRSEAYSLAAAKAAIEVYRREPIAKRIWECGTTLKTRINAMCAELGIDAECKGPPFRIGVMFNGGDPDTARKKRTLYHQELLKEGVTTINGVMLPSSIHDDAVVSATLSAVARALEVVAAAEREGALDRYLEIPLL